jgi:hypothetical protein
MTGHPFERRLQFRLHTLLFLTTIVAILAWLASFDDGREALLILASMAGLFGFLYLSIAMISFIVGTPGELQRRRRESVEECQSEIPMEERSATDDIRTHD